MSANHSLVVGWSREGVRILNHVMHTVVVKLLDYQILVNMMRRMMIGKSSLLEGLNTGVLPWLQ